MRRLSSICEVRLLDACSYLGRICLKGIFSRLKLPDGYCSLLLEMLGLSVVVCSFSEKAIELMRENVINGLVFCFRSDRSHRRYWYALANMCTMPAAATLLTQHIISMHGRLFGRY
jgi:hypothetical protein